VHRSEDYAALRNELLSEAGGVNMKECYTRRDFFRTLGLGTLSFGFGVSIFDSLHQYDRAGEAEDKHMLLMKGAVNFKGFMAKEIP